MRKKRVGSAVLTAALFLIVFSVLAVAQANCRVVVQATQADSSQLRQQREQVRRRADELRAAKERLKSELGGLSTDLEKISAAVSDLEDDIQDNKDEITLTQQRLREADEQKRQQYDSMKLRIQYMYEDSMNGSLAMILESKSFADFLNRISYVAELSDYDRDKLDVYGNTVNRIRESKVKLEKEQASLKKKQKSLTKKQRQFNASIEKTKSRMEQAADQEEAQKERMARLSDKIEAMERYEREMEARKAREAAQTQEKASEEEGGQKEHTEEGGQKEHTEEDHKSEHKDEEKKNRHSNAGATKHTAGDMELLSAIIYCEAGGSTYDCQLAVGSVIMNRIASSSFPNSVTGVVYQSGQFSPASSGRLAVVLENNLASSASRKAAEAVMSGTRTGSWLSFRLNTGSVRGDVIGSEVFY